MKRLVSVPRLSRWPVAELRYHPRPVFLSTKPPAKLEADGEVFRQAIPLGPYYESILNNPTPYPEEKPEEPPSSSPLTDSRSEPEPQKPKATRGRKPKDDKPPPPSSSNRKPKASAVPLSPPPSVETSPPAPTPPPASAQEQARIIFGSRLAGPAERAERLAEIRSRSRLIAGVLVPPRPDEPDNCCMSGCVDCVWDRYRDEMEAWAAAHGEAERRLRAQEAGLAGTATAPPPVGVGHDQSSDNAAVSMDDDGGGSESNWDVSSTGAAPGAGVSSKLSKDFWDEELYKNVPVGIREFMKTEKMLKLKHEREGTIGG